VATKKKLRKVFKSGGTTPHRRNLNGKKSTKRVRKKFLKAKVAGIADVGQEGGVTIEVVEDVVLVQNGVEGEDEAEVEVDVKVVLKDERYNNRSKLQNLKQQIILQRRMKRLMVFRSQRLLLHHKGHGDNML